MRKEKQKIDNESKSKREKQEGELNKECEDKELEEDLRKETRWKTN